MSIETNAILALLEDRPEAARKLYGSLPRRVIADDLGTLQGRISQAKENIRSEAVQSAIRAVMSKCLALESPELSKKAKSNPKLAEELREAYLQGVQAVEDILAKTLQECDNAKKILGPSKE